MRTQDVMGVRCVRPGSTWRTGLLCHGVSDGFHQRCVKLGIETSATDDDTAINYAGEKKAKEGGGGHGGATTTTTTTSTTTSKTKHAGGVRRGGSFMWEGCQLAHLLVRRLVEEEYHTRQSIRMNIEADYNDDDDNIDSDKDNNIGTDGDKKNECGHRGGLQAQSIMLMRW